jgi:hypothetical protein
MKGDHMTTPGFFIGGSIPGRFVPNRPARLTRGISSGQVMPAQNWGGLQRDGCVRPGVRQFSSILWNIPWGQSWENTCLTTPATIEGQSFSGATRCVNSSGHMWGQFDVTDSSCGCRFPLTTKTTCVGVTLWCREYCGPWEGGGRPVGDWYLCGGCVGFD